MTDKGVEAVDRALHILMAFDGAAEALPLSTLAERTGLPKSTILRLIVSLERFGCLSRDEGGRYVLGPTLFSLGECYRRGFRADAAVRPLLRRLVHETGESASLFIRDGDRRVCLFRHNSPNPARHHLEEGDVAGLDKGAGGKVLRAYTTDDPALAEVRQSGFHVSLGERDPDLAAVAAPVFVGGGAIFGALTVSGLATRFTPQAVNFITACVVEAAGELSKLLGAGRSRRPPSGADPG